MNGSAGPRDCPYVGLEPFEDAHRSYFFGRGRDIKIIADHVIARPITVLYGPSGVGKTSIINVGLGNDLPVLADWTIARLREWQDPKQIERRAVHALLQAARETPSWATEDCGFVPLVGWLTRKSRSPVLLVLDQFEEYFLYRDRDRMRDIETVMGNLVTRRDVRFHVLISIRDDAVHLLDQLRGAVPGILETTIKLDHLRDVDVDEAIRGPIVRYNAEFRIGQEEIKVEDDLPGALIRQLKDADTGLGKGRAFNSTVRRIELPYLQLALTRLWEESGGASASALNDDTLGKLGGVRRIVRDHVRKVMDQLALKEQALCAKLCDRLVTAIGSKVAYPTEGLAADDVVGEETSEEDVQAVLEKLTERRSRILKPVTTNDLPGFEIFHDVLALPVLEWKREFQTKARWREGELTWQLAQRRAYLLYVGGLSLIAVGVTVGVLFLNADEVVQWKFVPPSLHEGVRQFLGGFAGALASAAMTTLRAMELSAFWEKRAWAYFAALQLAMSMLAGLVPIVFDSQSFLTSFYLGLGVPIVIDSLVRNVGVISRDDPASVPTQRTKWLSRRPR